MFLGEYYHTLDNKGRITIPAVFRNQFTDGCVLTRGWEGYLIIYNKQAFMRMVRKSQELSPTVPEHRVLQRVMFSSAREVRSFEFYRCDSGPKACHESVTLLHSNNTIFNFNQWNAAEMKTPT